MADYPSVAEILDVVSTECGIAKADLVGDCRRRQFARHRQIIYWLAKQLTPLSFPRIAHEFGRDHTTILHGIRRIDQLRALDPKTKALTDRLLRLLSAMDDPRQLRLIA